MNYKERKCDLFSLPDDYYLAHCISADFAMGKGIATDFNKYFNMKNILKNRYSNFLQKYQKNKSKLSIVRLYGDLILEDRVFNLITKEKYFEKPTYRSLAESLLKMREVCKAYNIKKVAMPLIGCGLDGLEWNQVREIIKRMFRNTDIEILICYIDKKALVSKKNGK